MDTTAVRLKRALEIRNMRQSDLVEKTGIGKSSISTYLSGEYEPKQKNIYKIAKVLNISEAWLMGYDVPMDPQKPSAEEVLMQTAVEKERMDRIASVAFSMTDEEFEHFLMYGDFLVSKRSNQQDKE